jgi:hypothetical protein
MMTKLSITGKIIVSVLVVTTLVAASWESSKQQPESKRRLRAGKERKLESFSAFPTFSTTSSFSALDVPSFGATPFNPSLMPLPTGSNTAGVSGTGFGDNVDVQTFFGTAGGSGGGVTNSMGGGSIKPVLVANVPVFQMTSFGSNAESLAGGTGSGFVGEGVNAGLFSSFPGFGFNINDPAAEDEP